MSYINSGRMGLLGAPTYPMLRDATQVTLLEILHRNRIPYELNKSEGVLLLKDSGSHIILRAVDEFERLRGTNLAWFGVDELTYAPEDAWLRLEGRLRDPKAVSLGGFAVWTPKGYDWVFRRFIRDTVPGYDTILAAPFENRFVLSKVPDFYERLKRSYDPKLYEQEVRGEYLNTAGGRVYHAFDRKRNVQSLPLNRNQPLLWALDFNVDPMSSVVAQMRNGKLCVIAEQSLRRASTTEACERFYQIYGDHPAGIDIFADATGARMQTSGTSDHQMVRDFFARRNYRLCRFRVARSNPPVRERLRLVNQLLCNASGEVSLLVDPSCRGLIRDFEDVLYRPESSEVDKESNPSLTHLSDALGYLVWEEFGPRPSIGEQSQRLF